MASCYARGGLGCRLGKVHQKGYEALEQTAQASGGVMIPGGIWKMWRCGAYGHDLVVDLVVWGLCLDLMILKVFFNLNDSMILVFY